MTASIKIEDRLSIERRLSKTEENLVSLHRDLQEIKLTLKWLIGLVFSLNSTILGVVIKGFGLF